MGLANLLENLEIAGNPVCKNGALLIGEDGLCLLVPHDLKRMLGSGFLAQEMRGLDSHDCFSEQH